MKPGSCSQIASEIRMAEAVPLMESVIAMALAYAARLSEYPIASNSPTAYWLNNYYGVISEMISEINEEQCMQVELVEAVARELYVARCNSAYNPAFTPVVESHVVGWTATTWKAYNAIHAIFASEFGTPSGA